MTPERRQPSRACALEGVQGAMESDSNQVTRSAVGTSEPHVASLCTNVPVARGWRAKWTRVARFPLVRAQRRLAGRDDCHGRQDQGATRSLGVPKRAATRAAQRVLWQEAPSETVRSGTLPLGVLRACRGRSPAIAQRPRPQCRLHGAAAMRACRTERACAAPAEMSRLGDGGRRSAWGKLRRAPHHIRSSLVTITGARVR